MFSNRCDICCCFDDTNVSLYDKVITLIIRISEELRQKTIEPFLPQISLSISKTAERYIFMKQLLNKVPRVPECPSALAVQMPCDFPSAKTPSECQVPESHPSAPRNLRLVLTLPLNKNHPSEIFFKQKM